MEFTVTAKHDTLYKRGSKGEVRIWYMELGHTSEGIHGPGAHRVVSGIIDGALTTSEWSVCEPKNVGRSNATTSAYQAESEIFNLYVIKTDRDYFRNIEDIDKVAFTKPMLAVDYDKRKEKFDITQGVHAQPKLDGIRCIARADGLWTRTGKPISLSCKHIWDNIKHLFDADPDLILDGELYNHALKDDFNTITSIVRKAKPSEEDMAKARELIQYHVYDMPSSLGDFGARYESLLSLFSEFSFPQQNLLLPVHATYVDTQEELDRLNKEWLTAGYEGQMVRLPLSPYGFGKRSNSLLKRKEWITEEFPLTGMLPGTGNWADMIKTATVALPDGTEGEATFTGSQEELKKLKDEDRVPDWGTIKYFGYTPAGKLRFGNVIDYGWGQRED